MRFSLVVKTLWQKEDARTDWHASDRRCPRQSSISSSCPWRQTRLNTETVLQRRGQKSPQSDSLCFLRSLGLLGISCQTPDHSPEALSMAIHRKDRWYVGSGRDTACGAQPLTLHVMNWVNCFLNFYKEHIGDGAGSASSSRLGKEAGLVCIQFCHPSGQMRCDL